MKTKILFVCMMGRDRSQKAKQIIEEEFSEKFEAKAVGISEIADFPITQQAVDWADKIIFMERMHRNYSFERFPEARNKENEVWNISSNYSFNDKELDEELRWQIKEMIDYD